MDAGSVMCVLQGGSGVQGLQGQAREAAARQGRAWQSVAQRRKAAACSQAALGDPPPLWPEGDWSLCGAAWFRGGALGARRLGLRSGSGTAPRPARTQHSPSPPAQTAAGGQGIEAGAVKLIADGAVEYMWLHMFWVCTDTGRQPQTCVLGSCRLPPQPSARCRSAHPTCRCIRIVRSSSVGCIMG
jgi:hypothetical protein